MGQVRCCHPLSSPLVNEVGGRMQRMKEAGPVPYPPSHFKVWGRGATSSVSEGGSERAGHLPEVTQHIRGYNPGILDCSRSGSHCGAALLWWMEGESAGEFTDSLSLDLDDRLPTHKASPRLLSITALGCLISWSIQRSSATWRLGYSIFRSSNQGPCYQTRAPLHHRSGLYILKEDVARGQGTRTIYLAFQVPQKSLRPLLVSSLFLLFLNQYTTDSDQLP